MKFTIDVNIEELKEMYADYGSATVDEAVKKLVGDAFNRIKKAIDIPSIAVNPAKVLVE
jgi:hypothetical protein